MSFITASEAASLLGAALVGQDRILPQTFKVNSREITDGDVFVARKGKKSDGHLYIKDAICNGAAVVLAVVGRAAVTETHVPRARGGELHGGPVVG